jgi:Tol biopolymer transport system component
MNILRIWTIFAICGLLLAGCGVDETPGAAPEPVPGIAFASEREDNWDIYLIQADGSGLTRLTDNPEVDSEPAWSPDGLQIAFRSRREGSSDIFIMGADGSAPVNLINDPADSPDDEFAPNWHPDGEQLAIYSDRFPTAAGCRNEAHQMALMPTSGGAENIVLARAITGSQETFAWSPDGKVLAFSSICGGKNTHLYLWEPENGTVTQLTNGDHNNARPAWSHDGELLAFVSTRDGNPEIYVLELATGKLTNLTNHPALDRHPTWSPDDAQIAFTSSRDGNDEIYIMNADGSDPHNLTNHPARDFWPAWSPVP